MPFLHRGLPPCPCGGRVHGRGPPVPYGIPRRHGHPADADGKCPAHLFQRAVPNLLSDKISFPEKHGSEQKIHDLFFPELREQGYPGTWRQGHPRHAAVEWCAACLRCAKPQHEAGREHPLLPPVRLCDFLRQPLVGANPDHRPRRQLVLRQGLPELGVRPPGQVDRHRPQAVVCPGRDCRFQGGEGYPHLWLCRVVQTDLLRPVRPARILEQAAHLAKLPLPDSRPVRHPAAGRRGLCPVDQNDAGWRADSGQVPSVFLGHLHVRLLHRQHHD